MSKPGKSRLYLIDASGHIFRAFYAIPELSTSKGLKTNATLGFTNMIRKLLRDDLASRVRKGTEIRKIRTVSTEAA